MLYNNAIYLPELNALYGGMRRKASGVFPIQENGGLVKLLWFTVHSIILISNFQLIPLISRPFFSLIAETEHIARSY